MNTSSFGDLLRNARKAQKRKSGEIAVAIGRDKATVDRWESNVTRPHHSVLSQISAEYKIGLEELIQALANWQRCPQRKSPNKNKQSRLNPDLVVSIEDLMYLLEIAKELKHPMSLGMVADLASRLK